MGDGEGVMEEGREERENVRGDVKEEGRGGWLGWYEREGGGRKIYRTQIGEKKKEIL